MDYFWNLFGERQQTSENLIQAKFQEFTFYTLW